MRRSLRCQPFVVVVLLAVSQMVGMMLLLPHRVAAETQVRWISAATNDDGAAQTAPKSQRYWDKHNIERPDYAKTDAEVATERMNRMAVLLGSTVSCWKLGMKHILLFLGAAIAVVFLLVRWRTGHRWSSGGGGGAFSLWHSSSIQKTEEETRRARLARFDQGENNAVVNTNDHKED